jgi:hypothetical protein
MEKAFRAGIISTYQACLSNKLKTSYLIAGYVECQISRKTCFTHEGRKQYAN